MEAELAQDGSAEALRSGVSVALVGAPNAGKSTLLNLMQGLLMPTEGMVRPHSHLRMARYSQHLTEELPMDMSAMDYMLREYDAWLKKAHPDAQHDMIMRQWLGRFGVTGSRQTRPMQTLSDGMLSRIAFAAVTWCGTPLRWWWWWWWWSSS